MRAATLITILTCTAGCVVDGTDVETTEQAATASKRSSVTLAVIGDVPYGDPQLARFPALIEAVNADPSVGTVVHVGDIKNGSSLCSDAYLATISESFDSFVDPLVYTPGDNEWTDCHRTRAGKYDPLERLEALRDTFFPVPGVTLGKPKLVFSQSWFPWWQEYVENVSWIDARVVFTTLHVVGSNNDLLPWFADDATDALVDDPARRTAEFQRRNQANLDWLTLTFNTARLTHAPAVVIFMQADTWDAAAVANGAPVDGFSVLVRRLADLAADFGKPVLLVQGDSHQYLVDQPLANGDPMHGVTRHVPNLTRIVVHGETLPFEYLRLTIGIEHGAAALTWQRVPVATP